jgi:hypothetical protein
MKYYEAMSANTFPGVVTEIDKKAFYHVAGQAAAICLGNKQKQLPAVHFNVLIKTEELYKPQSNLLPEKYVRNPVIIAGGRLIQSLPLSYDEVTGSLSWFHQAEYRCAFEADISNLLAGPLAEAKYTALRDGKIFNAHSVNLRALHNYGDIQEMELVNEYMASFITYRAERKRKLSELLLAAFFFVNDSSNWRNITALATYIEDHFEDGIIHCEDVISLLGNMAETPICQ